ncbi:rho GTPase-activating protein 30 isoform X2 [Pleurodeles waltl]|uniref:rho GTPase-activating protein 30 isoform X2 n=1 Tax=Pleurodeles waltl TaxID=8319 RepID=UPI003709B0CF
MSSMSLAMKARQKVKKKGLTKDRVFGCDLLEHLQSTGLEVPQVLKSCTEFVEQHGIVDGIYRLSGISSNIQKLRQEFDMERSPDLNKEIYLQDIHCVSSLCKAYFRELPNPLLTYQLYDKFADAVAIQLEEGRLVKIKEVLKELPPPHYRTLEFLMKHLVHMASFSRETSMHARNLAIVWAPNLLRSKDIEASGFNGTAAFMEVRIQSIVVEFILTHVDQLFQDAPLKVGENECYRRSFPVAGTSASLPVCTKEDHYFRSLSYNLPSILNQGDGPPQIRPYHTIIDIADHKKGSLKVKKWKSIFNLGRSNNDSKRKITKQDDKDEKSSKMNLRSAKSMDSLSSMPCATEDPDIVVRSASQKSQNPLRHESFGTHSNQDTNQSLQASDQYSSKNSENEACAQTEGEITTKSEPTTPKAGRASVVANPQGRSPKTRNRAEKCAGVHISGPFSVTVPFHITSNLTLSRLTRGLECPALSHSMPDQGQLEKALLQEDEAPLIKSEVVPNIKPEKLDSVKDIIDALKEDSDESAERNRLSLEVQDSFSFLDSQDVNTEASFFEQDLDADHPVGSHSSSSSEDGVLGSINCFKMDYEMLEEDIRSQYINDISGSDMQVTEFSVEPPPDDMFSEDECDQMYFVPMGCSDNEDLSREEEEYSEEVYLSAYDDLSPLHKELPPLLEHVESQVSDLLGSRHVSGNLYQETITHNLSSGFLEGTESVMDPGNPLTDEKVCDLQLCVENNPACLELQQKNKNLHISEEMQVDPDTFDDKDNFRDNNEDSFIHTQVTIHQIDGTDTMENDSNSDRMKHSIEHAQTTEELKDNMSTESKESGQKLEIAFLELDMAIQSLNQIQENETLRLQPTTLEVDRVEIYDNLTGHTNQSQNIISEEPTASNADPLSNFKIEAILPFQGNYEFTSYRGVAPNTSGEVLEKKQPQMYSDGSVSMRFISTFAEIQQVKSAPVVPPKPQFAKLPPALKSKIHVGAASTDTPVGHSIKHGKPEKCHSIDLSHPIGSSPQKQQRSSWRNGGSVSFDAAHIKERHINQLPVRQMQTYSISDSHEIHKAYSLQNTLHLQKLKEKPLGIRSGRPVSCIGSLSSLENLRLEKGLNHEELAIFSFESPLVSNQKSFNFSQDPPARNRLSMPRLGQRSDTEEKSPCVLQQRRSIV